MKHEREDFVGEIFLIRKMIKKISGEYFVVILSHRSREEFLVVFFMYEENGEHDFVGSISHV